MLVNCYVIVGNSNFKQKIGKALVQIHLCLRQMVLVITLKTNES